MHGMIVWSWKASLWTNMQFLTGQGCSFSYWNRNRFTCLNLFVSGRTISVHAISSGLEISNSWNSGTECTAWSFDHGRLLYEPTCSSSRAKELLSIIYWIYLSLQKAIHSWIGCWVFLMAGWMFDWKQQRRSMSLLFRPACLLSPITFDRRAVSFHSMMDYHSQHKL